MKHTIQFADVNSMLMWLFENDISNTPLELVLILGETK